MGIGRLRASGSPAGSPGGGRTRISVGSIAFQMPKNVHFSTESVGITPKQACLELLTDLVLNYKKVCFKIYSSSFLHFSRLSESLSRRPVYRSTLFGSPHRPVCSFPFPPLWRSLVPPLFHFQLFLDVGQTANQRKGKKAKAAEKDKWGRSSNTVNLSLTLPWEAQRNGRPLPPVKNSRIYTLLLRIR